MWVAIHVGTFGTTTAALVFLATIARSWAARCSPHSAMSSAYRSSTGMSAGCHIVATGDDQASTHQRATRGGQGRPFDGACCPTIPITLHYIVRLPEIIER